MALLFGRYIPNRHPYARALAALRRGGPDDKGIYRNTRHDGHVTSDRAAKFEGATPPAPMADALLSALRSYYETRVRDHPRPEFLDPDLNQANLLGGAWPHGPAAIIHPDLELATMLDLAGLGRVFRWAHGPPSRDGFDNYTGGDGRADALAWIREEGGHRSDRDLVRLTLAALGAYRLANPYQPTWATTWNEMREYLGEPVERRLQLMGMTAPGERWVVTLRYRTREAGTLVRPSVLDANPSPSYFPSPPGSRSGHQMDLGPRAARRRPASVGRASRPLLSEYIHRQIEYRIEHWEAAEGRLEHARAATGSPVPLSAPRRRHHRRLATHYGQTLVRRWMPQPL